MSNFYKPHRHINWNYGGPNWRLSRSKIDLFIECPRCFYIDNKLGTARPRGFPMNLNTAVDTLLKKEFDSYRSKKQPHPLMEKFNVDAIPLDHPKMDTWRENFEGVDYFHEPTGMTICGAIDDLWVNKRGEVYVVDYKSTSKEEKVTLDADWQISYKRQMEIYQWLLR
jgi:RecB family exonuclease